MPSALALLRCGATLAGFSLASLLSAQDLDRLLPAPVPPQIPAEPEVPEPELTSVAQLLGPRPEETIVIPELKGIRLLSDPSQVTPRLTQMSSPIEFVGVTAMQTDAGIGLLSLALGQPVSRESLDRLLGAMRLVLAQTGAAFSIVALPPQDVTEGYLQLVVVESVVGKVRVEGNRWFSDQSYLARIEQTPGEPVNARGFNDGPERINANPFRRATVEVAAGAEPGTTDVIVRTRETRPVRIFASADNSGTVTTKEERFTTGFDWGNVWGLAHVLSAQWNSSWDFDTLRSVSGSYVMDLPRRHSLSLTGAYSRTNGLVAPPFALKGMSWQVSANYDIPLRARGAYTHAWQLGLDFKASDNNFTFATIPISDNLTHVAQARASYSGQFASGWGRSSFRATLTAAPGGLTDRNKSRYFSLSRAYSRADYVYFRGDISHALPLDSIKRGLAWSVRGQLQLANHNLIGSEQFGAGGRYSVRGYEEGEVYKDNGVLVIHELRLPPVSPRAGHTVQFYAFQDYADLWSTTSLPGERGVDLHSAGVGVDYSIGNRASLRAAYGWQFTDSGNSQTGDNSRLHLSGSLSF